MQLRLDKALVKRGLVSTRAKAEFMIKSGVILLNKKVVKKTSHLVKKEDFVAVAREANPWVSKAALKLEYAIEQFKLSPLSGVAIDVGASTGGFTEVLLSYGCSRVYAIDVGKGQLASKLKNNFRVINFEGVNARNLKGLELPLVDLIVCDASFISLEKVIKEPLFYAKHDCKLIALIKPQFEVGRKNIGKRGIVKDRQFQEDACLSVKLFLNQQGWDVTHLLECPIRGGSGNLEFLIAAKKKIFK